MMKNKIILILLVLLFLPMIKANGLIISEISTNQTNKVKDVDSSITFKITNNEPYTFYNLTFMDNSVIRMPKVNQLDSGQSIVINATIFTNENFIGKIEVIGFYQSTIGASNKTYNVTVNYNNGLSSCDMVLIKGDKIQWKSEVNDQITLRNAVTNMNIVVINPFDNYTTNFDSPEIFKYYFLRRGLRFTDICEIVVLNDVGLVNNPTLNGILNLSVTNQYKPTNLEVTVLTRDYSLNVFQGTEGVLIIKNIGIEIAKDVNITGDWFTFSENHFDLTPGSSNSLTYTLKPILSNTNQTNKTYTKNITISGNFPQKIEIFNINVSYGEIGPGNYSNYTGILGLLQEYCDANPKICKPDPVYIYRDESNFTNKFNVTFEEGQVNSMLDLQFDTLDGLNEFLTYLKDMEDTKNIRDNQTALEISNLRSYVEQKFTEETTNTENSNFFLILILSLIVIGLLITLIYNWKKYKNYQEHIVM